MLLSHRRHQLNRKQALQNYCPISSESIQFTLSGHPMFGETAIISCFFKICLCIIMIIQYKVRGGQPQRPVNFITRSHWDSNSKMGNHHRGKTRGACQATALDIPLPAHAMPVEQGALVPPPPGLPAFNPTRWHVNRGTCQNGSN